MVRLGIKLRGLFAYFAWFAVFPGWRPEGVKPRTKRNTRTDKGANHLSENIHALPGTGLSNPRGATRNTWSLAKSSSREYLFEVSALACAKSSKLTDS
jgi:hypothetical protein